MTACVWFCFCLWSCRDAVVFYHIVVSCLHRTQWTLLPTTLCLQKSVHLKLRSKLPKPPDSCLVPVSPVTTNIRLCSTVFWLITSVLNMGTVCSSETLVSTYGSTRLYSQKNVCILPPWEAQISNKYPQVFSRSSPMPEDNHQTVPPSSFYISLPVHHSRFKNGRY